ncbi:hypothetical protein Y032_0021g308 [Ancylostoma ceylanicum]|uniref:Uncharacterized protein n=1 Tax=Ancylostoma ceylanicum TaxID=53326 RepID=A0A016V1L8_9BILA|nr:hypothetical protein Y032_0021g308 [Ancylostoma ceylanicum]
MFDCSRVVALLLAKFGQGDVTNTTHQERKMAFYCASTIEDEEYIKENNAEKMDVDWDMDCENIETRSSSSNTLFIEFGRKRIPIEQVIRVIFFSEEGLIPGGHRAKLLLGGVVGLI